MPSGIYKHYSNQGKPTKKGEHLSLATEFKKGHKMQIGKNHWNYKRGKYKFQGYWMILRADGKGYVHQSRLVAEEKLGRPLKKTEVVHHINGIRDDDRPENLWVFPNDKAHGSYEGNLYRTYKKSPQYLSWIKENNDLISL